MSEPYRTALVTGATSGIGKATVARLRARGLAVYAVGRNRDALAELTRETGAVAVEADVRDVAASIELSRATMRKIKQNLFWAFFYNTIGIPIAALGLLNPIVAAAAMSLSSLSVVANSAMLKRVRLSGHEEVMT